MIGQTISHYKILAKLGAGGMGVVYKAHDIKLDRLVALKFLSTHLSASEQDKARFIQEAKAASALNHPNVCTIHDILEHEGQQFIVMEYVDGQTLSEKIKQQKANIKQIVDIGIQVAEGLAAAHEKGIFHRDIKPENIMIRKDGIVQIMDFGLAKLRGASRLTKDGSALGTVGYMSPEQAQGLDTDHRTDIFSLGVVLYELLAGHPPFRGEYEAAIMYEILNVAPPPLSSSRENIDPELEQIILECLEKDPEERYQSTKEIARQLRRIKRESGRQRVGRISAAQSSEGLKPSLGLKLTWIVAALCCLGFIAALALLYLRPTPTTPPTTRSFIPPPENTTFAYQVGTAGGGHIALSPDGNTLAFVAADSTGRQYLWIRHLQALSAQRLSGTEGAYYPFWSPDNRFIGFFTAGTLKKIAASGGPPVTICDTGPVPGAGRGGTWNQDGVILFALVFGVIYQVSAAGGEPAAATKRDTTHRDFTHWWPCFLPDGKHFLYFARTGGAGSEDDAICLASLEGNVSKRLLRASSNMAYAEGYLIYLVLQR